MSAHVPTTIVWFDRDLRVSDHEPLRAAAARGRVVPLYVWAPRDEGAWAPGAAWRWFLHHALTSLGDDLARLGAPLVVRSGAPERVLAQVIEATGADAVYLHRRFTPALAARDAGIAKRLEARGVTWRELDGWLLHRPEQVRTAAGDPYRVFTPFWRAVARVLPPSAPAPAPPKLTPAAADLASARVADLGLLPAIPWDAGLRATWAPWESVALQALESFAADRVDGYGADRDRPDRSGTSRMSPYLAHGIVSPRQVWHAVAGTCGDPFARGPGGAEYLRQLLWREFAWHVLVAHPETLERPMQRRFEAFPWRDDPEAVQRWQRGETGYPLVDAGMRELWHTGWLHNRVRMVAASFLTKHLLVDWREGARWFWDTLVDADLANNTLGWQWVAGSGADAAPYFRIFDPTAQAERHDPDGAYRATWLPTGGGDGVTPIVEHRQARERALRAYRMLA